MAYTLAGRWYVAYGRTEWHGVGVLAGIVGVALLASETFRVFFPTSERRAEAARNLCELVLAISLVILTICAFESETTYRYWTAWAGLGVSTLLAATGLLRTAILSRRELGGLHRGFGLRRVPMT